MVTLFYGLTYFYGTQIVRIVHQGEGWLTIAAITGGVIVGVVFLWLYLRRRKAARSGRQCKPAQRRETRRLNGPPYQTCPIDSKIEQ